ncbi:MAG: alpha-L-glutamate ligase-like protein [Sulfurimonas sp.]|nr:alpha-L-glutamate ligase-like protein [Sulfurimonas sp.]
MIIFPSELKKLGILGMNARNIDYIGKCNDRKLYPLVDDKLQTKQLATQHGLKTPEFFGAVEYQGQIKNIEDLLPKKSGFVIKPAQGSGGKGILIIHKRENDIFYKPSGESLTLIDIKRHTSNILSGLYSLCGKDDVAIIEKLIEFDEVFDGFSFEGIPDIRIIIYKGYPVMAMIRLSTSMSDGKANLHQGAVGVGIDILTGKAISAVQYDRPIFHHPDTGKELLKLEVPYWEEILYLACGSYDMTNLGYLGADIVLDKYEGPMLLELNARPGLTIQIANSQGIIHRLSMIDEVSVTHENIQQRIDFSLKNFKNNV